MRSLLCLLAFSLVATAVRGQGTRADYERADGLREKWRGKVLNQKIEPHWAADGGSFWYRRELPGGGAEFITITSATGERAVAKEAPAKIAEPEKPAPKKRPPGREPRATSPDGKWLAFLREANVWLREVASGEESQLTRDGTADDFYRDDFQWSPDAQHLVAMRVRKAQEHKVYLIESSPKDQLQPRLLSYDYLKPGDRIAQEKPHLFDLATRAEIAIDDTLFQNPWDIGSLRWEPNSRRFTFVFNQRGHQVLRIIAVDAVDRRSAGDRGRAERDVHRLLGQTVCPLRR